MERERGCVVWMTGLPSGGKTTLATMLEAELIGQGRRVERLDGDELRTHLTKGLGFSRADRDENVRRVGWVACLLARHGVIAITALISPYRSARDEVRRSTEDFIEVWVKAALDACIRRDVKGLYRKALAGEIAQFTGVSDPYEPPLHPEVVVETDRQTPAESVATILAANKHWNTTFVDQAAGGRWLSSISSSRNHRASIRRKLLAATRAPTRIAWAMRVQARCRMRRSHESG